MNSSALMDFRALDGEQDQEVSHGQMAWNGQDRQRGQVFAVVNYHTIYNNQMFCWNSGAVSFFSADETVSERSVAKGSRITPWTDQGSITGHTPVAHTPASRFPLFNHASVHVFGLLVGNWKTHTGKCQRRIKSLARIKPKNLLLLCQPPPPKKKEIPALPFSVSMNTE